MGSKVVKINGVCRRTPLIGKNLFVDFPNIEANPFTGRDGDVLMVAVCGAMQIRTSRCFPSYNPDTKTATIMFHFTRPSWAEKAKERIEAMRTLFAHSILREEDSIPASEEDLGLDQAM